MRSAYAVTEGKIHSAQCEINIVEHCNLSCRSCSHLSPVMPRHEVDPAILEQNLNLIGRHYHVKLIKLLGGEPLLHRRLLDMIAAVRRSGVADGIAVITNGVLLSRMPPEFWAGVDEVVVSLYPGNKQTTEDLDQWQEAATTATVDLRIQRINEFRESYTEIGTDDARLVRRIYRSCDLAHTWRCHTIADGHFWKCPQAYFLAKLFSDDERPEYDDGVKIEHGPTLGAKLLAYLASPEPLAACGHCLGTAGKRLPHGQARRGNFRALQRRSTEQLVDFSMLAPRPVRRLRARWQRMW